MEIELRPVVTSGVSLFLGKGPEGAGIVLCIELGIGYMNVYICVYVKIHHVISTLKKTSILYCVYYTSIESKTNN